MKKYLIIILAVLFSSIFLISIAKAQPSPTPVTATSAAISPAPSASIPATGEVSLPPQPSNLPSITIEKAIPNFVKIIFAVAEIAFVLVFLISGITYITSMGEEAKMEKAKKTITTALIGIVVVFSAYAVASFLLTNVLK